MLTASGIGSYRTQAAAEFVTNDEKMKAILEDAPRGWEREGFPGSAPHQGHIQRPSRRRGCQHDVVVTFLSRRGSPRNFRS